MTLTTDLRPEQHPPAAGVGLLLTSIPAADPHFVRRVHSWQDQEQVHKAVMALFAPHLDGPSQERRATNHILYRLETSPTGQPRVLIQHGTPLHQDHPEARTLSLTPFLTHLTAGLHIRFRIDLNAVVNLNHSNKRQPVTNTYLRPETDPPTPASDADILTRPDGGMIVDRLRPFLRRRLQHSLTNIEVPDEPKITVQALGRHPLHTVRYDGRAVVRDPTRLTTQISEGIGRARAYGCGLLSLAVTR